MFLGACEARLSVLMYKHSALFSKRKTLGAYTTEWWRDAQSKSSSQLIPFCICGELQDCTLRLCSIALPCPLKPSILLDKTQGSPTPTTILPFSSSKLNSLPSSPFGCSPPNRDACCILNVSSIHLLVSVWDSIFPLMCLSCFPDKWLPSSVFRQPFKRF